jgi:hypothetical protein
MSIPVSYVSGEEKRENDCAVLEHEKENEETLMKEYYGSYGQTNGQSNPSSETQQLSENEISNEIDKAMNEDKESDDLV